MYVVYHFLLQNLSVCTLSIISDQNMRVCRLSACWIPFLTSKPVCLYIVNNFWHKKTCVSFCLPVIYPFLLQTLSVCLCLPFLLQKMSVCLPLFGCKLDPNPCFSEAGSMIRTRIRVKMEWSIDHYQVYAWFKTVFSSTHKRDRLTPDMHHIKIFWKHLDNILK